MAVGTKELLATLKIDPEFRDKIPPLTDTEYEQLRENILEAGEVYEPIRVWNGTVIDGHNRLKVIQENPEVKWQTRDMEFVDKWAAFDWMYRNQLGRRNLTDEQRTYMIGKMYEARKKSIGAPIGNSNAEKQSDQSGHVEKPKTRKALADELGVGEGTVQRAEKFKDGVDAIREVSPEAADKILTGASGAARRDIAGLAAATEEEVKDAANAIINDKPIKKSKPIKSDAIEESVRSSPKQSEESETDESIDTSAYNIHDLIGEVNDNGDDYIRGLRTLLEHRFPQFDNKTNRMRLRNAIGVIIEGFKILRSEYEDE